METFDRSLKTCLLTKYVYRYIHNIGKVLCCRSLKVFESIVTLWIECTSYALLSEVPVQNFDPNLCDS